MQRFFQHWIKSLNVCVLMSPLRLLVHNQPVFNQSIITLRLSKADQMKTAASPRVLLASRREQLSNCCFAAPLPLPASNIIP